MSRQDRADRDGPLPHGRLPVVLAGGQFDLAEDRVDHAVEEVAFVGDVVVERHRGAAEVLAELAHAEGLDAVLVGEVDGGGQHPRSGPGGPGISARMGLLGHPLPPRLALGNTTLTGNTLLSVHRTCNVHRTWGRARVTGSRNTSLPSRSLRWRTA